MAGVTNATSADRLWRKRRQCCADMCPAHDHNSVKPQTH